MAISNRSLLKLPLALGGSISTANVRPVAETGRLRAIAQAEGLERDRQAILSMVGEYKVKFEFEEFEPADGYSASPPYRSGAFELVLLAEDAGNRIVLQHLLVHRRMGFVIKHWRQDWHYEAQKRLEFTQDQTWRISAIDPAETKGAWTQSVYEVSDAPRYSGTGRWNHEDNASTWTSGAGWRPLPRREYSKRSDYNALGVVNIHRITADGWEHVQNNRKVIREGEREVSTLVHERGVNSYRLVTGYDFGPGYRYWNRTQNYWRRIRSEWDRRVEQYQGARLKYPVNGMKMIWSMYIQSERARLGLPVGDCGIRNLFDPWVVAPSVQPAGQEK